MFFKILSKKHFNKKRQKRNNHRLESTSKDFKKQLARKAYT